MDYTELSNNILEYLEKHQTEKRFIHSLEVANMAKFIASKKGYNPNISYIAGLSHDIAREMPIKKQKEMISLLGVFSPEFYENPLLYHGPIGALILKDRFKIQSKEILDAVKYHSFGSKDIGYIPKIVYISDYISYDRIHITNSFRNNLLYLSIDEMVLKIIKSYAKHLESNDKTILTETKNMYNNISRMLSEKEKRI